ncbi:hypothetical protein [Anaerolentibacter hominis]|uniref:hypothetical protein n=1 Tax=Anaerolentibacter hominis TaxID=3079009 RepID=UPI0031B80FBD
MKKRTNIRGANPLQIYAQVRKADSRVNLIGGMDLGLYDFDLPLAYTVDVTNRIENEDIRVGMVYDPEADSFLEYIPEPVEPQPEPVRETTAEELLAQIQLNTEYLACMAEINQ